MSERMEARVAAALAAQDWQTTGELSLRGLDLRELPSLPREIVRLRSLDLSGNRLTEVPEQVLALGALERLDLAGNRLSALTPAIGALRGLDSLDLSENRLTALPAELAACHRLERVDVYDNQLRDLGPLAALPVLRVLDAARNRLSALGPLPPRLANLDLSGNDLTALPPWLAALVALRRLDLSGNHLSSAAVQVLISLGLQELYLDDNALGEPPLELAAEPWLRHFSAHGNPFGDLPPQPLPGRDIGMEVERAVHERISGAAEPGRRYYDAPTYSFDFDVLLETPRDAREVVDLYYKRFRQVPANVELSDGTSLQLPRLSRRTALARIEGTEATRGSARLGFEPTQGRDAVEATSAFVAQAVARLPHAALLSHGDAPDVAFVTESEPPPPSPVTTASGGDRGSEVSGAPAGNEPSAAAEPEEPPVPDVRPEPEAMPAPAPLPEVMPEPAPAEAEPTAPEAEPEPPADAGPRVLNAAVTDTGNSVLPLRQSLDPFSVYLLRIDIGAWSPESVVHDPVPIPVEQVEPSSPDGWWFEVVAASSDVDVSPDLHRIFLPWAGPSWVCPCSGAAHHCTVDERRRYLIVPFTTRERVSPASLRATLYDRGNAVQSLRLTFSVGPGEVPISGEIDYTLAEDAGSAQALAPRRLHVLTNVTPGGTHTIVVNEGSRAIAVDVGDAQASAVLAPIRAKLTELTLGKDGEPFPYDANNEKPRDAFIADLGALARLGSQLWVAVVPDGDDRAFLREAARERAAIQISRVTRTTFPWALIYDIPRESDPPWQPCELLAHWEERRGALAGYPASCPFLDSHDVNTLCPYGFWGFRHLIEQPPSVRSGVLRDRIDAVAPARAATARSLALDQTLTTKHFAELGSSLHGRITLDPCDARQALQEAFADPALPLVYFYCHGRTALVAGTAMGTPVLEIGQGDHIGASDLAAWYDTGGWGPDHWQATAPLVFINGCGTVALSPEDVVSLVDALAGLKVAGIVGTEIAVDQRLAGEVALRFYAQFAGAQPQSVGTALHRTRIDLLGKGNVSGLAYTPFCSLDLALHVTH